MHISLLPKGDVPVLVPTGGMAKAMALKDDVLSQGLTFNVQELLLGRMHTQKYGLCPLA